MTIEIYQLKITAKDIQPKIERVLWIKSTATFLNLHRTLQTLFGLCAECQMNSIFMQIRN